jgi:hypothetical protein
LSSGLNDISSTLDITSFGTGNSVHFLRTKISPVSRLKNLCPPHMLLGP